MLKAGDIIYSVSKGTYHLMKVLVVDKLKVAGGGAHHVVHCMTFKPSKLKPTSKNLDKFEVSIMHSPFSLNEADYTFVANKPVTKDELYGYEVYQAHSQRAVK